MGEPVPKIVKLTGLSLEAIEEIRRQSNVKYQSSSERVHCACEIEVRTIEDGK